MCKYKLLQRYLGELTTPQQREMAKNVFDELWSKYSYNTQYYRELLSNRLISVTYFRKVTAIHRHDLTQNLHSQLRTIAKLLA